MQRHLQNPAGLSKGAGRLPLVLTVAGCLGAWVAGCSSVQDEALPALTSLATDAASAMNAQVDALTPAPGETGAIASPPTSGAQPPGQAVPAAHPLRVNRSTRVAAVQAPAAATSASAFGEATPLARALKPGKTTSPDRALVLAGVPSANFTKIASALLRCTLRRDRPLAERYIFFGETPPGKGTALFAIHQRTAEGRHGRRVYKGELIRGAGGTVLNIANIALPVALANEISNDIERWTGSSTTTCSAGAAHKSAG